MRVLERRNGFIAYETQLLLTSIDGGRGVAVHVQLPAINCVANQATVHLTMRCG